MEDSKEGFKSESVCAFPTVFCLKINHSGAFTPPPKIRYKGGKVNWVDTIDSDVFSVVKVNNMMKELGYEKPSFDYYYKEPKNDLDNGLKKLSSNQDVLIMLKYIEKYKVIDLYVDHSITNETVNVDESLLVNELDNDLFLGNEMLRDNDKDVIEDVSEDEWLQKSLRSNIDANVEWVGSKAIVTIEEEEFEEEEVNHDELDSGSNSEYKESGGTTWKENFYVGLKFINSKEIKEMVTRVAVEQRRELHLKKNDKVRVRFICRGKVPQFGCEDGDDDSGSKGVVSSGSKGRVSPMKRVKAKKMAQEKVEGNHTRQYAQLRDYCLELKNSNPNTTIKIEVEPPEDINNTERKFKRVYVCLGPLKDGFKAGKRDLLGLDGCFLSGSYLGWILTAVGVDLNNGIYPLTYAIVESENKDSWKWFLECVGDDLHLFRNSNFTFISDRQHGIIPAIAESFPSTKYKFFLKHIYDNMKLSWRGQMKIDWNGGDLYQATTSCGDQCVVNMRTKECSCRKWELTGIPCKHALAAIWDMAGNGEETAIPESYCHQVHWLLTWKDMYMFKVNPCKSITYGKCKGIGYNQRKCPNDASAQTATQTQQSSQAPSATQATQSSQTDHTTPFHPSHLHVSPTKMTKASAARRSST
uniref:Transposase, mutator type n=1 Tax=Tanacetum cinerariifolium TaxID=118510 RepID=A0A699HV74_TANCI|nr:transposase, mutator type [Tanacetum cinerariifolium]